VWVVGSHRGRGIVAQLDPETGLVRGDPAELPRATPVAVAAAGDTIWVAANDLVKGNALLRLDARTGAVEATTPVEAKLGDVAVNPQGVWALAARLRNGEFEETVIRVDPATGRTLVAVPLSRIPWQQVIRLATDDRGAWAIVHGAGDRLVHVDGATGEASPPIPPDFEADAGAADLAVGDDALWVAASNGCESRGLSRIDPLTGRVASTLGPTGHVFLTVAVSEEAVWAGSGASGCGEAQ
jgi:DNA-binding beta-propeller fold protein YncE